MQRRHLLPLLAALGILQVHALAQSGTIGADPNPCTVERGKTACTTHITWTTQGVSRVKVIVMDAHKRGREREQEFGASLECAGRNCRAPWIEPGNEYVFTLYDFSSGHRGAALSSVTVTANAGESRR